MMDLCIKTTILRSAMTTFLLWSTVMFLSTMYCKRILLEYGENKLVDVDRLFDDCSEFESYPVRTSIGDVFSVDGFMQFNIYSNVSINLPRKLEVNLDVERCATKEAPDTCLKTAHLKSDRVCSMIEAANDLIGSVLKCVTPKVTCPLKKGHYVGSNCTVDMKNFKFFPLMNFYWIIRTSFWIKTPKRILLCGISSGQMKRKRSKE